MRKIVFLIVLVLSVFLLSIANETQQILKLTYLTQMGELNLVTYEAGILTDTDITYLQGCQNQFAKWSSDGKLLYCPNNLRIWENGISTKIPATRQYSEGWWSPDGDKIALVDFNGNFDVSVWLIDLQTQHEQILVRTYGGLANIEWRGNDIISFSLDFGVLDQFRIVLNGETSHVLEFPEFGPNIGLVNGSSIALPPRPRQMLPEMEVWLMFAQIGLHNTDYYISDIRTKGEYTLLSVGVMPELIRNGTGHTPIVILCKGHTVLWHAIEAYGGEFG